MEHIDADKLRHYNQDTLKTQIQNTVSCKLDLVKDTIMGVLDESIPIRKLLLQS